MQPIKTVILETVQHVSVEVVKIVTRHISKKKPQDILELMDEYRSLSMEYVNNYSSLSVEDINRIECSLERIRDRCAPYCTKWLA